MKLMVWYPSKKKKEKTTVVLTAQCKQINSKINWMGVIDFTVLYVFLHWITSKGSSADRCVRVCVCVCCSQRWHFPYLNGITSNNVEYVCKMHERTHGHHRTTLTKYRNFRLNSNIKSSSFHTWVLIKFEEWASFGVLMVFEARNGRKHTAPRTSHTYMVYDIRCVYGCVWFVVLSSAYNKSHFVLAVAVADSFAFDIKIVAPTTEIERIGLQDERAKKIANEKETEWELERVCC